MKIPALLVCVRSVPHGAVDLTGRGGTPSAALAALALQLGVAAQPDPLEVVRQRGPVQAAHRVVHLQAVQGLHGGQEGLCDFYTCGRYVFASS